MPEQIRLTRDQLQVVFSDFETLRQFELVLDTLNQISNTTIGSLQDDIDSKAPLLNPNFTANITVNGDIFVTGNVDGRDIATDGAKLDGIEAGAEVNDVDSVNSKTGAVVLVKADIGLGNVDNTSDLNKPVSTATQTALNLKADIASPSFTGDVSTSGDSIRIDTSKTPSSASDTGTTGEIAWDSDYIYVCVATDTWKRVAISTW